MVREFSVAIEKDADGFFVASEPALRRCHTQAKSLDVLMKCVRQPIELCLEVEEPVATAFVAVQPVAVESWAPPPADQPYAPCVSAAWRQHYSLQVVGIRRPDIRTSAPTWTQLRPSRHSTPG